MWGEDGVWRRYLVCSECDKKGEDGDEGVWDDWVSEGREEKGEVVVDEMERGDAEAEKEEGEDAGEEEDWGLGDDLT